MTDRHGAARTGWTAFVVERMALPPLLLMTTALSASMQVLVGDTVDPYRTALTATGLTALLALLRVMDDVKDLERDRLAHPDRPIARGVLSQSSAERGITVGVATLLTGAGALMAVDRVAAGLLLTVCVLWALLMYVEFFVDDLLAAHPIVYVVSHQAIVLPMYGFTAAMVGRDALSDPLAWWFAAAGLGASFAWEVCRKLDPADHPVLGTYVVRLGPGVTILMAVLALSVVLGAGARLELLAVLGPVVALVLVGLAISRTSPGGHRWAAAAAGLLAAVQPIAPLLGHWWGIR